MLSTIRAVRVEKIIMSGSGHRIGDIKYSDIIGPKPINTSQLPSARPLFYNFSQYPTVNEIVFILTAPKTNFNSTGHTIDYYLPPINIHGSPNHNALPGELTATEQHYRFETGERGYFTENSNIRPLLPYEGDVMVEGRQGNSIRFGATIQGSHQPNNWSTDTSQSIGHPIIIIRNGQKNVTEKDEILGTKHILEDINTDHSSIYLCSKQQISNFQKAGVGFKDYELSYKHML